jgi:hypothetical protein
VERANDLVAITNIKFLRRNLLNTHTASIYASDLHANTHLGKDLSLRQVPEHFVGVELALVLSVLGHLKYSNLAALALGKLDLLVLRKLFTQVMHHRCLGQQERNRGLETDEHTSIRYTDLTCLFPVVRPGPDNLQVSLRLKLDDANLEHLVEQNRDRSVPVRRLQDLRDHLVQRALENLARLAGV